MFLGICFIFDVMGYGSGSCLEDSRLLFFMVGVV